MKNGYSEFKENDGRTRYEVKGTDGWTLVTHDEDIARRAESSSNKEFGSNRVSRSKYV